ncbi:G patch domain-containing protein 1 homolog isoform X2 [Cephus cinctus]|nr:G patch domain-containing protein 1 homolog isoform X2 [Cephus cinctus]
MGWKPGQGVGPRITKREKIKILHQNRGVKVYGCSLPVQQEEMVANESDASDDEHVDITFAPDDYEPFRLNPKDNCFGIGYTGLDRRPVLSGHVNLFEIPAFNIQDKDKKLSIHGQAFGVGVFEVDDEDIYAKDDMSRYNFALGPERKTKSRWSQKEDSASTSQEKCIEGFIYAKNRLEDKKIFKPPELPPDFKPIHVARKSRFYPPIDQNLIYENGKPKGLARHDLNAEDRYKIINDNPLKASTLHNDIQKEIQPVNVSGNTSVTAKIICRTLNLQGREHEQEKKRQEAQQAKGNISWLEKLTATNFVKGGMVGTDPSVTGALTNFKVFENLCSRNTSEIVSSDTPSNTSSIQSVRPFLPDIEKQKRFEQYIIFSQNGEKKKLASIQPLSMSEWERDHEVVEFDQALRLFVPPVSTDIKLVSCELEHSSTATTESKINRNMKTKDKSKIMRTKIEWQPAHIVCKRFNIPEPRAGCAKPESDKKISKFSVFNCLDFSGNSEKFETATRMIEKKKCQVGLDQGRMEKRPAVLSEQETETHLNISTEASNASVSHKLRRFEATYEKVFGKGVQDILLTLKSNIDRQQPNITENSDSNSGTDVTGHQDSSATPKDKTEDKKDLFKAIFLSSSEDSDTGVEDNIDSEKVKSVLIGKTCEQVNLQRNTSPARGIFAQLDFNELIIPTRRKESNDNESIETTKQETKVLIISKSTDQNLARKEIIKLSEEAPDMYGPALPQIPPNHDNSPDKLDSNISQARKPIFKNIVLKSSVETKVLGKWVEKSKVKKSKKEKKKHKHKDKSKHKRKSKKSKY